MSKVFNPQNALRLETEERYNAIPPLSVLSRYFPENAKTCVDVGCGTGFFTLPLSRLVNNGKVYALDISDDMLAHLNNKITNEPPNNSYSSIVPLIMPSDSVPLDDGLADFTFCSFVLHEVPLMKDFAGELVRITAPGGVVVILEWDMKPSPFGPPVDHRISPEFVAGLFDSGRIKSVQAEKIGEWFYAVKVEID